MFISYFLMKDFVLEFEKGKYYFRYVLNALASLNKTNLKINKNLYLDDKIFNFIYQLHHVNLDEIIQDDIKIYMNSFFINELYKESKKEYFKEQMYNISSYNIQEFLKSRCKTSYSEIKIKLKYHKKPRLK